MDPLVLFLVSGLLSLMDIAKIAPINRSMLSLLRSLPDWLACVIKNTNLKTIKLELVIFQNPAIMEFFMKMDFPIQQLRMSFWEKKKDNKNYYLREKMYIHRELLWAMIDQRFLAVEFLLRFIQIDCVSLDELYLIFCTMPRIFFWRFENLIKELPFQMPRYPDYQTMSFRVAAKRWCNIAQGGSCDQYDFMSLYQFSNARFLSKNIEYLEPHLKSFKKHFKYFGRTCFPEYVYKNGNTEGCLWLSIATTVPRLLMIRDMDTLTQIAKKYDLEQFDNCVYAIYCSLPKIRRDHRWLVDSDDEYYFSYAKPKFSLFHKL